MIRMNCTDGSTLWPYGPCGPFVEYPDGARENLSVVYARYNDTHEHDWNVEAYGKACDLEGLPTMWVLRCAGCGQIKLAPIPYLLERGA